MKILLGDFNTNVGSENIFKPTIGNESLHTYLLTLWSRVLLEKPTGFKLIKKFQAFYGTRRFITAFTNEGHLPPS
jgi:hypothetical protein